MTRRAPNAGDRRSPRRRAYLATRQGGKRARRGARPRRRVGGLAKGRLESIATPSTIASRTSRVTLGTSALILPLRKTVRFATTGRRSTRTLPTSVLAPEARNSAARSTRWSSRWPACSTTSATMWTSRSCCSDICGHGQRSRTAASSTRLGRLCGGALVIGIHGVRFCGRHPRTPQKSSAVNARTLAAETISSMRM